MAVGTLEKVMKKREFAPILKGQVSALETSIIIEDTEGKLLMAKGHGIRQSTIYRRSQKLEHLHS